MEKQDSGGQIKSATEQTTALLKYIQQRGNPVFTPEQEARIREIIQEEQEPQRRFKDACRTAMGREGIKAQAPDGIKHADDYIREVSEEVERQIWADRNYAERLAHCSRARAGERTPLRSQVSLYIALL